MQSLNKKAPTLTQKKILKIIATASLSSTLIYLVLILFLNRAVIPAMRDFGSGIQTVIVVTAFALIAVIFPIREKFWNIKKARVSSAENFYSTLLVLSIISLEIAETIGICGLVLFILTGKIVFPLLLLVISFAGKVIYFPWEAEINRKKREVAFPID